MGARRPGRGRGRERRRQVSPTVAITVDFSRLNGNGDFAFCCSPGAAEEGDEQDGDGEDDESTTGQQTKDSGYAGLAYYPGRGIV